MDMLALANQREQAGDHVIHMEVGQPSYRAPRAAREAAAAALEAEKLGYSEALGRPALRERIARSYKELYGIDVAPERVVVTTGSSGGFILAFLAGFDAGARVALTRPGYPAYCNILKGLDLAPAYLDVSAKTRWAPEPAAIEALAADGVSGLLLASPANPTGTSLSAEALGQVAEIARQRGLWLISDEIYHRLEYGPPSPTALAHLDDAIIINSFSKYYCMTGWRIGWMVVPDRLVRPIERLAQNLFISPPAISQIAALAAFDAIDELEERKAVYARNRDMLMEELPRAGLPDHTPMDGAFYVYADVSRYTNDSHDFAREMLAEIGVASAPGADFDEAEGARYLRFSFCVSNEEMAEGVKRLKGWLKTRRSR